MDGSTELSLGPDAHDLATRSGIDLRLHALSARLEAAAVKVSLPARKSSHRPVPVVQPCGPSFVRSAE